MEDFDEQNKDNNVYLSINELKKSYNEKVAIAIKLYCQFGYSTSEKLKKWIKSSNIDESLLEIIDTIDNKC